MSAVQRVDHNARDNCVSKHAKSYRGYNRGLDVVQVMVQRRVEVLLYLEASRGLTFGPSIE